jgi:hypothetical protein
MVQNEAVERNISAELDLSTHNYLTAMLLCGTGVAASRHPFGSVRHEPEGSIDANRW